MLAIIHALLFHRREIILTRNYILFYFEGEVSSVQLVR